MALAEETLAVVTREVALSIVAEPSITVQFTDCTAANPALAKPFSAKAVEGASAQRTSSSPASADGPIWSL